VLRISESEGGEAMSPFLRYLVCLLIGVMLGAASALEMCARADEKNLQQLQSRNQEIATLKAEQPTAYVSCPAGGMYVESKDPNVPLVMASCGKGNMLLFGLTLNVFTDKKHHDAFIQSEPEKP
jgi:hypothetical protein